LQSGRPTLQHDEPERATEANSARGRAAGSLRAALCLWAQLDGQIVEVLTEAAPPKDGQIFVRASDDESVRPVDAASLKLLRIGGERSDRTGR